MRASSYTFKEFWTENTEILPLLKSVAIQYCASPATSVPSESSFSVAGHYSRKERANLSNENLRYSMLLRESDEVEKLIERLN